MTTRTPRTRLDGFHRSVALVFAVMVITGASGCLLGGDSGEPVLAIDLFWDEKPGDRYLGSTCEQAGVVSMKWTLRDDDGKTVVSSGKEPVDCENTIVVPRNVGPGTYSLEVTGFDEQDQEMWSSSDDCGGYGFDRFDQLYSCDIDR